MEDSRLGHLAENLRTFLMSKISREAFVFAFFVLLSAAFWLMQALDESYEMDLEYDLVLESVPEGTVVTSDLPSPIHVVVRDKGTSLVHYYSRFKRPLLKVDFTDYDKGSTFGHVVLSDNELQILLQPSLEASSKIVSIRPDTLDYYYSRSERRRIPVNFVGHLQTDAKSYLADVVVSPDSVTVWGEEHFLDSLESVSTVKVNLTELSQTITRQVPLVALKGAKMVPDAVTLTAEVDVYTEKEVNVPIVGTNFPAGYTLRTFPSYATIHFRVGVKNYKAVTPERFVLTATYEELMALPDSILHLTLRSVPEEVSQVRIQPEAVQFLIEQTEE